MLLSNIITGYFLDRQTELSPRTVEQYKYFYEMFQKYLTNDPLFESITAKQVKGFLAHLLHERGLSKKTGSNAWAALSSLWRWASAELACENILKEVAAPKVVSKPIEIFTADEIKRMLAAAEYKKTYRQKGKLVRNRRPSGLRDRAIILALLDCGLRATELCNMKISDYEPSRGRLLVKGGKGDKDRIVYAGRRTQKALWRYLATRPKARPTDPLFAAGAFADSHIDRNNLRHMLATIGANAGVTNVHPHRFRHTMAVAFLRAGGGLAQLRLILGHSELRTVLIYARLAECDLEKAAADHSPADAWRL